MISIELKAIVDSNNECCCEHKLAHKCKEWALNKNYEIWSVSKNKRGEAQIEHFKNGTMAVRDGKTEPESIFQACEWVLSQTKLQ